MDAPSMDTASALSQRSYSPRVPTLVRSQPLTLGQFSRQQRRSVLANGGSTEELTALTSVATYDDGASGASSDEDGESSIDIDLERAVEDFADDATGALRAADASPGGADDDTAAAPVTLIAIIRAFVLLAAATISMTLGNKYILTRWEYEGVLLSIQSTACVAILIVGGTLHRLTKIGLQMERFTMKQFKIYALCCLFVSLQLLTSMLGLPKVTVATITVFQNCRTIGITFAEIIFLREFFPLRVLAAVAVTIGGSVAYGMSDLRKGGNYDPMGYFWMGINTAVSILASIVYRYVNPKAKQTGWGIALIENTLMLPAFIAMALVFNAARADQRPFASLLEQDVGVWICIAITSVGSAVIGAAYANCYMVSAATTIAVMSMGNKCIAIVLGLFIFKKALHAVQWGAIAVIMVGGFWFSYERRKQKVAEKAKAAEEMVDAATRTRQAQAAASAGSTRKAARRAEASAQDVAAEIAAIDAYNALEKARASASPPPPPVVHASLERAVELTAVVDMGGSTAPPPAPAPTPSGGDDPVFAAGTLLHKTELMKRKVAKEIEIRGSGIYARSRASSVFQLLKARGDGATPFTEHEGDGGGGFTVRGSTFLFAEEGEVVDREIWFVALAKCGFAPTEGGQRAAGAERSGAEEAP